MPTAAATQTPNYITGQVIAVSIANRMAYCVSGNCDTEVQIIKKTNSRSGGYQEVRPGTKMASGELELAYNGDEPPQITEGAFCTLVIDTEGYEISEGQENQTVGQGGATTPTAPTGEVLTINAMFSKVSRNWNADSGDYSWKVAYTSSGAYTVGSATGASATT